MSGRPRARGSYERRRTGQPSCSCSSSCSCSAAPVPARRCARRCARRAAPPALLASLGPDRTGPDRPPACVHRTHSAARRSRAALPPLNLPPTLGPWSHVSPPRACHRARTRAAVRGRARRYIGIVPPSSASPARGGRPAPWRLRPRTRGAARLPRRPGPSTKVRRPATPCRSVSGVASVTLPCRARALFGLASAPYAGIQ